MDGVQINNTEQLMPPLPGEMVYPESINIPNLTDFYNADAITIDNLIRQYNIDNENDNLNCMNCLRLGWILGYKSGFIEGYHRGAFAVPPMDFNDETHMINNDNNNVMEITPNTTPNNSLPPSPVRRIGGKNMKKTKKKWSLKYKRSINCKKPKGFSQKQYCKRVNKIKSKRK